MNKASIEHLLSLPNVEEINRHYPDLVGNFQTTMFGQAMSVWISLEKGNDLVSFLDGITASELSTLTLTAEVYEDFLEAARRFFSKQFDLETMDVPDRKLFEFIKRTLFVSMMQYFADSMVESEVFQPPWKLDFASPDSLLDSDIFPQLAQNLTPLLEEICAEQTYLVEDSKAITVVQLIAGILIPSISQQENINKFKIQLYQVLLSYYQKTTSSWTEHHTEELKFFCETHNQFFAFNLLKVTERF